MVKGQLQPLCWHHILQEVQTLGSAVIKVVRLLSDRRLLPAFRRLYKGSAIPLV